MAALRFGLQRRMLMWEEVEGARQNSTPRGTVISTMVPRGPRTRDGHKVG